MTSVLEYKKIDKQREAINVFFAPTENLTKKKRISIKDEQAKFNKYF